jgi:hypothetical protein
MFQLDSRSQSLAALLLAVLMAATRIHHFGVGTIAPDASTAVFFLAGLMLASPLWFVLFTALAVGLDVIALGFIGVADACMTPGYWLLFGGYLALWYAGRLGRSVERLDLVQGCKLLLLAAGGTLLFFVISNVGYYFGGGYDQSMGAAEYVSRVQRYFPMYLVSTLAYAAGGIAVFTIAARLIAGERLAAP